jgi:hypothetical protein
MMHRRAVGILLLAVPLHACSDLEVTNPNSPDAAAAIADAATVEALVAGSFQSWFRAQYDYSGVGLALSGLSFQHATFAVCRAPHAELPRTVFLNDEANPYCAHIIFPWDNLYMGLAAVADGLQALERDPSVREGMSDDEADRLLAFARFVQGVSHGSLALLYDRAFVSDEHSPTLGREPLPYDAVMDTALAFLREAATLAEGAGWADIPADWMSVPVSADGLARLAHSFSARYRAAVARTPAERAAVDWDAVMADVRAGVTESWVMDMDPAAGWYNEVIGYGTYPGAIGDPYFIIGMADQSGSYQRWLDLPLEQRVPNPDTDGDGVGDPILIVTPDTRFPRGATLADQEASPGSLYVIPDGLEGRIGDRDRAWGIVNTWRRPERGTWRWTYYWHIDAERYAYFDDFAWPEIEAAEMRLLEAEGLLRTGDAAGAAALVNVSRTAAGLRPTDGAGTNLDCVPRLPRGSCGDLMEMLKWEKRLETHYTGLHAAPWYFDGRGWGDLYAGTFLQLPIPCEEIHVLRTLPCYSFGGQGGTSAAPVSVYAWPGEG